MSDELGFELRRISAMVRSDDEAGVRLPPGPLAQRLGEAFGLRGIDVDLALAVLGIELDHQFATLLGAVTARSPRGILSALVPTIEHRLALADAIGPNARAVRKRLLRATPRDHETYFVATRRFRAAVLGRDLLAELPTFAAHVALALPPFTWTPAGSELVIDAMSKIEGSALCIVTGPPGVGKTTWVCGAARELGRPVLRLDVAVAARADDPVVELREIVEDAALLGVTCILDNAGPMLGPDSRLGRIIEAMLDEIEVKIFVISDDREQFDERLTSRALGRIVIGPPPPAIRRKLWATANAAAASLNTIADDLVLTPRQIMNAVALVNRGGADPAVAAFEQLPKSRNLTLPDRVSSRLDALILPPEVRAEIEELINAIRTRGNVHSILSFSSGKAITGLFDGDSGTGKTFACQCISAEVGLPLLRVDVSSLVDKYIGETEKNLSRVFALAAAQGGILFFDEADALFGNRVEVSRSQDRAANMETNLLLQLMEQFSGIVLLTTNLKRNVDQAFMRRIMFKVYFEVPEAGQRKQLWQSIIPPDQFDEDINFDRLAKTFELTGGSIKAATLRCAYRAAARAGKITMSDLVECAQLEAQGLGQVATWTT